MAFLKNKLVDKIERDSGNFNHLKVYSSFSNYIVDNLNNEKINYEWLSNPKNSKNFDDWCFANNFFVDKQGQKLKDINLADAFIASVAYYKSLKINKDFKVNKNFKNTSLHNDFLNNLRTDFDAESKKIINEFYKQVPVEQRITTNEITSISNKYDALFNFFASTSPAAVALKDTKVPPAALFYAFNSVTKSDPKAREEEFIKNIQSFDPKLAENNKSKFYHWTQLMFSFGRCNNVNERCSTINFNNDIYKDGNKIKYQKNREVSQLRH